MKGIGRFQRRFRGSPQGGILGLMLPVMAAAQAPEPVTYAEDVAPILQGKCQVCHRPGSVAPMPLLRHPWRAPWPHRWFASLSLPGRKGEARAA